MNFLENAFETMLSGISSVGQFAQVAKDLEVSVKISNIVDSNDPQRNVSFLAETTWRDLLQDQKRCKLDGPVNTQDLLFIISSDGNNLSVTVKSSYLEKEDPKSDAGKAFKEFLDSTANMVDEIFNRDHSLSLEKLSLLNKTKQTGALIDFYNEKLRKIFFSVLVRKFTTEAYKD